MSAQTLTLVVDTNVYVSAALRGELSERILQLAAAGRVRVIASPAILDELAEKMRGRFGWSAQQVKTLLETLKTIVEVTGLWQETSGANRESKKSCGSPLALRTV